MVKCFIMLESFVTEEFILLNMIVNLFLSYIPSWLVLVLRK
jgi:hypothetical protein